MSNHNDHDKERSPAVDLEALSRAYEQSLRDVSFGGKSVPMPSNEENRQKAAPSGELKDFTPKASPWESDDSDEHDKIVRKIRQNRKKLSHSVWTDEPILKPKKSVWIDDSTTQYDRNELRQEAARQEAARQEAARQQAARQAAVRANNTDPRQTQKQSAPKKSEPLILAMTEPAQADARNERQEVRRSQQSYDELPIRPILNEKPKKQELVMRMDGRGASRVREIPRQPNKKQVTMRMSPETFEEYRRNGINSDNSVRRTVSINMPVSKMRPEEEEKHREEEKQEDKREKQPKASAKDIVDDIAQKIVGKKSKPSAAKEPENEVAAMSLDEIIRETQEAAKLRQAEEELLKEKQSEETSAADEAGESVQAEPQVSSVSDEKEIAAEAEGEANETAKESSEADVKKADLQKEDDTEAEVEASNKDTRDEDPDSADDSESKEEDPAEKAAEAIDEVHKASESSAKDEIEEASAESTDSADSSDSAEDTEHSADDDGEVYNFTGLINKVKAQRMKPVPSADESRQTEEEEYIEPTAELPLEEIMSYSAEAEKKHAKRKKKLKYHEGEFGFINSAMCLGLVFTIFLSLLLMKRESGFISSENRDLAVFPKFTAEGYVTGEFARDVTTYFTDTVPGRETFQKFGAVFRSNLGINLDDTVVTGNHKVAQKEEADKDKLATTTTVTVNTDITENTDDKKKDDPSAASTKTTKKSKTSEEVVELPDVLDDGQWEGDVIVFGKGKDIRAVAGYYGLFGTGTLYAETINKWKEELGDVNVYNMSIPTASAYYLPDSFKDTVSDQKDNIDNIAAELRGIVNVDVYDELNKHKDEYIYSRTDHHWQPLGAYYAGRVFAEKAGIFYPDISSYEKYEIEGFLGTMYSYSNFDTRLADNPDTFIYYKPSNDYTVRYYDTEFKDPLESTMFFDNAEGVGCYSAVLGRDEEITEIETDSSNGRVLVIFKDSYGNVLAPFFTQSFEKIYVCDFRYFDLNAIDFCKRVGCTDLLFAVSLTSCSTEMHITAINNDRIQLDPDTAATSEVTTLYNFDKPEEDGENEEGDENANGENGDTDTPVFGANDNAQFGGNNYANGY